MSNRGYPQTRPAWCHLPDASAPLGRSINDLTTAPPICMVSPADVFARVDKSSWAAKTDIKCAFRNNPLNPMQSGLLAIEFEGFYYWELRSPFGWSLAPFSWCHLTEFIQRFCVCPLWPLRSPLVVGVAVCRLLRAQKPLDGSLWSRHIVPGY